MSKIFIYGGVSYPMPNQTATVIVIFGGMLLLAILMLWDFFDRRS